MFQNFVWFWVAYCLNISLSFNYPSIYFSFVYNLCFQYDMLVSLRCSTCVYALDLWSLRNPWEWDDSRFCAFITTRALLSPVQQFRRVSEVDWRHQHGSGHAVGTGPAQRRRLTETLPEATASRHHDALQRCESLTCAPHSFERVMKHFKLELVFCYLCCFNAIKHNG